MKKLKISLIIPICIALTFCSCSDTDISFSASEITDAFENAVKLDEGYHSASDKYFDYYFKLDGSSIRNDVSEFAIRCSNSQSSENEFGVIKALRGKVQNVESACKRYLEARKNAYLDAKAAYSPDEYEKYSNAKIIRNGDTVIYFILSLQDAEKAEKALNELLKP